MPANYSEVYLAHKSRPENLLLTDNPLEVDEIEHDLGDIIGYYSQVADAAEGYNKVNDRSVLLDTILESLGIFLTDDHFLLFTM